MNIHLKSKEELVLFLNCTKCEILQKMSLGPKFSWTKRFKLSWTLIHLCLVINRLKVAFLDFVALRESKSWHASKTEKSFFLTKIAAWAQLRVHNLPATETDNFFAAIVRNVTPANFWGSLLYCDKLGLIILPVPDLINFLEYWSYSNLKLNRSGQ